ncbi:hypothetical protein [Streptomyces sp. NPDC088789]|uniref:hypothetical protein n=1 Tax=Streptomyces sp. NPDC088789 TaxID=3365899 RepID=UPI00382C60D0
MSDGNRQNASGQDATDQAREEVFATYRSLAAQAGLTGQVGDSPNPGHWQRVMTTSAPTTTTTSTAGQTNATVSAASWMQPLTQESYARSAQNTSGTSQPSAYQGNNQTRQNQSGRSR